MFIKYFLVVVLLIPAFYSESLYSMDNEIYTPLLIRSVLNDSQKPVSLEDSQYSIEISADTSRRINFSQPFSIPFLSITNYIAAFTQAAKGKFFIPEGSLLVKIGNVNLGIWENEVGIMYATDAEGSTPIFTLLKNINKKGAKENTAIAKALCYLLSINNKGEMVLDNAAIE